MASSPGSLCHHCYVQQAVRAHFLHTAPPTPIAEQVVHQNSLLCEVRWVARH